MTTFTTIQQTLAPELQLLNQQIQLTLNSPNELMNRVIKNYLEKKGKQIRPIMVLLSAKLLKEVNPNVIAGAVAVELLHNASLIHDDVVDDTMTRRGTPTINGKWDNHMAVLIGDFFLSNALLQASSTNDIRIVRSISNLGRLLSIGELDEIYNARYTNLNEETYFNIIFRKTASLFVSCVEVGAFGVDVDDERLDALREYARLLGLCFQIKDDIFDYFSDEKIGKPTGNDLREGKVTLPLLHALENKDNPNHLKMVELAHKDSLQPDEINTLIQFAIDEGGIDYAYATMQRMRDDAAKILDRFPNSPERQALLSLFNFIIERDN
jgi:octaprenyl-diphosphate synthase